MEVSEAVVDLGLNRVQKFQADGTWVLSWGRSGSGPGEFSAPQGIDVDEQFRI
jgi:hypothetical protein